MTSEALGSALHVARFEAGKELPRSVEHVAVLPRDLRHPHLSQRKV
jgi:hypothetical protein